MRYLVDWRGLKNVCDKIDGRGTGEGVTLNRFSGSSSYVYHPHDLLSSFMKTLID